MVRLAFVVVFGAMAYAMAQGAEDWQQAIVLGGLPLFAGLASVYLASDI